MKMKVLSIVNQKGGCGKTIISVNLAAALSRKQKKTLLIDLDPQAHASFSLQKRSPITITDVLEGFSPEKNYSPQDFTVTVAENFYLLSSTIGLASLDHKMGLRKDRLHVLSGFLKAIAMYFDYVILDCPPNLGLLTLNALEASNYSVIPINICEFSLKGVEILKDIFVMLKEFEGRTPTPFYILTQVDTRSKFARDFLERAEKQFSNMLLKTKIRLNIHLRAAAFDGKNIFEYKPDSRGAEDFTLLADEINNLTGQTTWASLFLRGKNLEEVYVIGDFTNWQKQDKYKLNRTSEDLWSINLPLEKGNYRYKFLSGESWLPDPYNKIKERDPFGGINSVLVVE